MTEHTRPSAFDIDLQDLSPHGRRDGRPARSSMVADRRRRSAPSATWRWRNGHRRRRVVDRRCSARCEERGRSTIARRQPMALDLREIVGALRIANDLERIGDLAKNIAKRVLALDGRVPAAEADRAASSTMAAAGARSSCKAVLDGYAAPRRRQGAGGHGAATTRSTRMCTSLFRELLTYMMEDPRNITFCIHLLFCAKNIERMGDHATNIAETVHYVIEGRADHRHRPKGDTTSFRRLPMQGYGTAMSVMNSPHPGSWLWKTRSRWSLLLRYNLETEGYEVETVGARRRGRYPAAGKRARSSGARLDAARAFRHRDSAAGCGRGPKRSKLPIIMLTARRRGERAGSRSFDRRRRLRRQAVLRCRNCWRGSRALLRRAQPELVSPIR